MIRLTTTWLTACALFLIVAGGIVAKAWALADCDGSTPKSDWCGTTTQCADPQQNPQTQEWYCPNQSIQRQFIQAFCNAGSGKGSTLCAAVSTQLVCTKRYTCVYSEIVNQDTGEVMSRMCARGIDDPGVTNSQASKKDYTQCNDTSGG